MHQLGSKLPIKEEWPDRNKRRANREKLRRGLHRAVASSAKVRVPKGTVRRAEADFGPHAGKSYTVREGYRYEPPDITVWMIIVPVGLIFVIWKITSAQWGTETFIGFAVIVVLWLIYKVLWQLPMRSLRKLKKKYARR